MNQTQSIIIYRNPLEQQMWEGLMAGNLFPYMAGFFIFFVVFLSSNSVMSNFVPGAWRKAWPSYVSLGIGAISAVATVYFLSI